MKSRKTGGMLQMKKTLFQICWTFTKRLTEKKVRMKALVFSTTLELKKKKKKVISLRFKYIHV